jgi:hypothetical protein
MARRTGEPDMSTSRGRAVRNPLRESVCDDMWAGCPVRSVRRRANHRLANAWPGNTLRQVSR